jgi:hypothetical protein
MLSLITGLVYTLLLTRNMSIPEFGVWSFIFYLVGLFTVISGLFTFWATRFVARKKEGAIKTAITANLIVGLAAAAIYVPLVAPIMSAFNVDSVYYFIYLLAALQILETFVIAMMEACLQAVKPQAVGYGLLIQEAVKIALAYVIIVEFNQLFLGAMVSLLAGFAVQVLFYGWLLNGELRQKIRWGYVKEWLKGSPAFAYNAIGNQLTALTLYLLVYYSGHAALGEYQAALTFSAVIGYASSLAFALYPKMLAEDCPTDVAASFKTVIMIALPIAAVAFTMSQSLLTILNESYAAAAPILSLLVFDALIVLVSQFYTQCLLGTETMDVEGKISVRKLIRSKIFKVFTLPYIQAAFALPSIYLVLTRVVFADPVQAAMYVVAINIVVHSATFAGMYVLMRKSMKLSVAWLSVGKYVLGALASGAVLFVLPQTTTLTATLGKAIVGVGAYIALLYVIDGDARKLVTQVLAEVKGIFSRKPSLR